MATDYVFPSEWDGSNCVTSCGALHATLDFRDDLGIFRPRRSAQDDRVACLIEDFFRCDNRVAVNPDRIFDSRSIASSVGHHQRNIPRLGYAKNQLVPPLEAFDTQFESDKLILLVWVGTGDITD